MSLTPADVQAILVEFNEVGTHLSTADAELAGLEAFGLGGRGDLMLPYSVRAHTAVGIAGLAMARAAALLKRALGDDAAAAQPHLPPGMAVADVSTTLGEYTGPLDPDTVTPGGWRYWGEHNELHAKTGQIFSKQPTLLDPATGKLLTMGDYANVDPDGAVFKPFE